MLSASASASASAPAPVLFTREQITVTLNAEACRITELVKQLHHRVVALLQTHPNRDLLGPLYAQYADEYLAHVDRIVATVLSDRKSPVIVDLLREQTNGHGNSKAVRVLEEFVARATSVRVMWDMISQQQETSVRLLQQYKIGNPTLLSRLWSQLCALRGSGSGSGSGADTGSEQPLVYRICERALPVLRLLVQVMPVWDSSLSHLPVLPRGGPTLRSSPL